MLQVQPRASRSELAGLHGSALKVRIAAPPVSGAANLELVRFLAELLGVPRSQVQVIAGQSSRRKVALVHGITQPVAERKLGLTGVGTR